MTRNVVLALAIVLLAAPALAHAVKEEVIPAPEATLDGSPAAIAMRFDTAMRITRFALTDRDGRSFDLERRDGMAPVTAFAATPETLPPGDYIVEWSGIAADGHTMSGAWTFTVR